MPSHPVNAGVFAAGIRPKGGPCFRIRLEAEVVYRCLRPKGHLHGHYDPELAATWEELQDEPVAHSHDWTPEGAALATILIGTRPEMN